MAVTRVSEWQVQWGRYPEFMKCLAEAKRIQMAHGATSIRGYASALAGDSFGAHYFLMEFPDLESYARAMKALPADPEWQTWLNTYMLVADPPGRIVSQRMMDELAI
jgi:hypothetical protein